MRLLCYTISLISLSFFCFGQPKKEDKNERVFKALVGSWKLDYAVYSATLLGIVSYDTSKIFYTDTIHFFNDRTFKFRSNAIENIGVQTHTGTWEITNKGKVLIHKNIQSLPPSAEPTRDATFPIKIINPDRIRIDYTIYHPQDYSPPRLNNTPVFFERIK